MTCKLVVAVLALSPLMLHAKAITPAQPQVVSSVPGLQAKLERPLQLFVASGPDVHPLHAGDRPVSSGVTTPKLIHSVGVETSSDSLCLENNNCKFVVEMTVDALGKPSDLKMIQSSNVAMDWSVLHAVGKYRFTPAMLNNQRIAMPVDLEVDIDNSSR